MKYFNLKFIQIRIPRNFAQPIHLLDIHFPEQQEGTIISHSMWNAFTLPLYPLVFLPYCLYSILFII